MLFVLTNVPGWQDESVMLILQKKKKKKNHSLFCIELLKWLKKNIKFKILLFLTNVPGGKKEGLMIIMKKKKKKKSQPILHRIIYM